MKSLYESILDDEEQNVSAVNNKVDTDYILELLNEHIATHAFSKWRTDEFTFSNGNLHITDKALHKGRIRYLILSDKLSKVCRSITSDNYDVEVCILDDCESAKCLESMSKGMRLILADASEVSSLLDDYAKQHISGKLPADVHHLKICRLTVDASKLQLSHPVELEFIRNAKSIQGFEAYIICKNMDELQQTLQKFKVTNVSGESITMRLQGEIKNDIKSRLKKMGAKYRITGPEGRQGVIDTFFSQNIQDLLDKTFEGWTRPDEPANIGLRYISVDGNLLFEFNHIDRYYNRLENGNALYQNNSKRKYWIYTK